MKRTIFAAAVGVMAWMAGSAGHASVMTYTSGSTHDTSQTDQYPQTGDRHESSVSGAGAKGSFSAWARADYGTLKVFASGAASENSHAAAFASASVGDTITFNNAALDGKKGQFTVSFYADSILGGENYTPWGPFGSSANFNLDVMMGTSYLGIESSRLLVRQSLVVDDDPGWTSSSSRLWDQDVHGITDTEVTGKFFSLTQEFVWGVPVYYQMNMWVDGFFGNYPYHPYTDVRGSFSADGGNSTYWNGITSIITDGIEISDYSLVSASGTDYSQSFLPVPEVPEPAAFGMLGAGLAFLVLRQRLDRRLPRY